MSSDIENLFIGIESDPAHFEVACQWIEDALRQDRRDVQPIPRKTDVFPEPCEDLQPSGIESNSHDRNLQFTPIQTRPRSIEYRIYRMVEGKGASGVVGQ